MSLFNDASLVLIPSGYKEDTIYSVKPTDGSGDLTFTRASDGTRVNSQGYIERVPWNLLQQSNTFSTSPWSVAGGTLTSGQTGYDGSNNAWLLNSSVAGQSYLNQSIAQSGIQTFSVYLKKGTADFATIIVRITSSYTIYIDLTDGSYINTTFLFQEINIEDVGNDWWRVKLTYDGTISFIRIFVADAISSFNSEIGDNIYIQNAQLNEGSTAKPYFPTTDRLNVPRLDYSNGCPSLLLEPQRTNLALYSEQFDNAAWSLIGATVNDNVVLSLDGTINADELIGDGTSTSVRTYQVITLSATTYTLSVFLKSGNTNVGYIEFSGFSGITGTTTAYFDLENGTTPTSGAKIEDYGNGWYRCSISATIDPSDTSGNVSFRATPSTIAASFPTSGDADGKYIYLWGAQLEQGSYPTSYIPTTSASVTRVADAISRDNIYTNGLISASGGTWFVELKNNVSYFRDNTNRWGISDTSNVSNDAIVFRGLTPGRYGIYKLIAGTLTYLCTTTTDNCKIAIKWNGSTADVFENGTKVVSATAFTTTAMEYISSNSGGAMPVPTYIQQMDLFPTPLTDAECIALTTI